MQWINCYLMRQRNRMYQPIMAGWDKKTAMATLHQPSALLNNAGYQIGACIISDGMTNFLRNKCFLERFLI